MYQRILIPIDGSPTSNKALDAAVRLAREAGGSLRVVHVLDDLASITGYEYRGDLVALARDEGAKILASALSFAKAAGVEADSSLVESAGKRLGDTVAQEAREWKADLVVVGTHGRKGVSRVLLGSGAEQVIRAAAVPVLVIRADDTAAQA